MPNLPLKLPLPCSQKLLKMCIACYCCLSPFLVHIFPFSFLLPCLFSFFIFFFFFMGKPSASLLSFSNFAKISLPFFQHALSSFTESSERLERQEDEPPTMAKVVTQAQKEALHNGLVSILYLSLSLLFFFFF